jgi:hypothetical protein
VRLLGRKGVMNAQLVVAPESLQASLPRFDQMLAGFSYKDGQRYAQYVEGDHVAEYGLGRVRARRRGHALRQAGLLQRSSGSSRGRLEFILIAAAVGGRRSRSSGARSPARRSSTRPTRSG